MHRFEKPFSQVLEQYAFKVANHFIGSVEPSSQTALIDLVKMVSHTDNPTALKEGQTSPPSEWDAVLNEPVDWGSVHRRWSLGVIRENIRRHKGYQDRLEQIVLTTRYRLQAVQDSQLSEIRRNQLIDYYQYTLAAYEQQLAKAISIYEKHFAHFESRVEILL